MVLAATPTTQTCSGHASNAEADVELPATGLSDQPCLWQAQSESRCA